MGGKLDMFHHNGEKYFLKEHYFLSTVQGVPHLRKNQTWSPTYAVLVLYVQIKNFCVNRGPLTVPQTLICVNRGPLTVPQTLISCNVVLKPTCGDPL